jgi:nitronate monooxygenase
MPSVSARVDAFCRQFGLQVPILLAPMAGVPSPALSIAVAEAGGMGACGVLPMPPDEIGNWCSTFRAGCDGAFQLNTWIPDPPPERNAVEEARVRAFLRSWGPEVPTEAGDAPVQDFAAQCDAMLAARPTVISSIMGVYPPPFVDAMKAHGIAWFACATSVGEARMAEEAGADAIVAQGSEAGGHRGAFQASQAQRQMIGLLALVPAIVDAVRLPVVATGGIADGRGVAAALALGASAVQVGTRFLRSPESGIHPAWASALSAAAPEDTMITRAFSGRPGRSLSTSFVEAMTSAGAPEPAPYPIQRALTAPMRAAAIRDGDVNRMQAWAGQSAALAAALPAREVVRTMWETAQELLA